MYGGQSSKGFLVDTHLLLSNHTSMTSVSEWPLGNSYCTGAFGLGPGNSNSASIHSGVNIDNGTLANAGGAAMGAIAIFSAISWYSHQSLLPPTMSHLDLYHSNIKFIPTYVL